MALSSIIVTDAFDLLEEELEQDYPEARIIRIEAEEFLIAHAQEVMEQAYLTSDRMRIFMLCSWRFSPLAQNKLLKILEEPPSKVQFVLATPTLHGLLVTITSRLSVVRMKSAKSDDTNQAWRTIDTQKLLELLQAHRRSDAKMVRVMIESWGRQLAKEGAFAHYHRLIPYFEESVRLLDMGSPPPFVLARLGLALMREGI